MSTQSRVIMNTCFQGLGSARLQGKLLGIVYIDDIIIITILHHLGRGEIKDAQVHCKKVP